MANISSIKLPNGTTYNLKDNGALQLTGGQVTGPVTFGDSITVDEATIGDLVVNGAASFTNNIQANTINGIAVGNNPKFTDTVTTVSVTGSGNAVTAASASNGVVTLTKGATFLTSYTETDPVFSASAAAGITSTDISNWNAKVSDDHKWGDVLLNKTIYANQTTYYIPFLTGTSSTQADLVQAKATPTAKTIAVFDENAYLKSTTPSANDNSTKVATTAYVNAAIPDTSRFIPTITNATSIDARDGFTLYQYNNTSTGGFRRLSLGNDINYKTSGGAYGVIRFYDGGQYYRGDLLPNLNLTGDQTWTLPNKTGTIALTSDIPQVYSSTNTGGYLRMSDLPTYGGDVTTSWTGGSY